MRLIWLKIFHYFRFKSESLKEAFLNLVDFLYVRIYLIIILTINLLNWIASITINKYVSQDLIFLHYNVTFGINLVGSVKKIYIIPTLGLLILLINFMLSLYIYRQGRFLVHLLLFTAILANLFLLAAIASVYLINFR